MKKFISILLAAVLLFSCVLIGTSGVQAASKTAESRAIAIVFDNSGSMYIGGNKAWCRATYATEVFASMLNEGDTLLIYPMNPIEIDGKAYSMDDPLQMTSESDPSMIRRFLTHGVGDTHIESIDAAYAGLGKVNADQKYVVVLSDGDDFYQDGHSMGKSASVKGLNERFEKANEEIRMMYLGIGGPALMPDTPDSAVFIKKKAAQSEDVLSSLTEMCNQIFGRDTLPKKFLSENSVEFDISMSKLIVFIQGTNISDVKLVGPDGNPVGTQVSAQQTQYATQGSDHGPYVPNAVDEGLQGMMVTYTDCAAGKYTLQYGGSASSVEVYYEPDADLDFVFTDAVGNTVDPKALYEGEYMVSFGMKDAKTGKLSESELLGNPNYKGSYFVNEQEYSITHDGYSGAVKVPLKMGDTFDANLTVTYLSGYKIRKDSRDFGWPEGGIQVAARPAGDMKLEISGGQELYSLQKLTEGEPYIAKVYYQGQQLTGDELESVELMWESDTSNAEITKEFADDHWNLYLGYKDPEAPQETVCGECTVFIYAFYSAQGSSEAQTESPLTYNIKDDFSPLRINLFAPETYIVIGDLDKSQPIVANLTMNGRPLNAEEFAAVQLQVDCGGIEHIVTPNEQDSSYAIKLASTAGLTEGDYPVKIQAQYTDAIGRVTETEETVRLTLSSLPLWMKWLIRLGILLLLIIIIVLIMRIKVMPKKVMTSANNGSLTVGPSQVTASVSYPTKRSGSTLSVLCKKGGGTAFGVKMKVAPGPDSHLSKKSKNRSMIVNPKDVTVQNGGNATIKAANVNGVRYEIDPKTHKFSPIQQTTKPFVLKNYASVRWEGTILDGGRQKSFSATTKLEFKDK